VRFGGELFVPALLVPVVTVLVATVGPLITIGGTPCSPTGAPR
jgi:uncharacterized membrane protein